MAPKTIDERAKEIHRYICQCFSDQSCIDFIKQHFEEALKDAGKCKCPLKKNVHSKVNIKK